MYGAVAFDLDDTLAMTRRDRETLLRTAAESAGVALTFESGVPRAKLVLLAVFLLITSPTATHAITRAAHDQGIEPWTAERGDEE